MEKTSIHDMLKDTPPMVEINRRSNNVVPSVQINPICQSQQYTSTSRSVQIGLSTMSGANSPAILTPTAATNTSEDIPTAINTQIDDSPSLKTSTSRVEHLKNWSISTYKCTKQLMFEKLGKTSRTVDTELELQIEQLRETQKKYIYIMRLAKSLYSHFCHVVVTQHALDDAFSDLAQKSPELQEEFLYNAETQRNLHKNGKTLLCALEFFISSVETLCHKTIEDTFNSIQLYHAARIEYDAYRSELETLKAKSSTTGNNNYNCKAMEEGCKHHHQQFIKFRTEVTIKMKFLDENRIKVMRKQLLLFHNAIAAYFSGNQIALESTLKQFNIKLKSQSSTNSSWLEQ